MTLTVYGKKGCCLCDQALKAARALQSKYGYTVAYVDIGDIPELRQKYAEHLPVLFLDEREVMRGKVGQLPLDRALARLVKRASS